MRTREVKKRPQAWLSTTLLILVCYLCSWIQLLEGTCEPRNGCSTALAYYTVQGGERLNVLVDRFETTLDAVKFYNVVNGSNLVDRGQNLLFPFPCGCVHNQLSHSFTYEVKDGDTLYEIATTKFQGLSHVHSIAEASGMASPDDMIYPGDNLQVPVQCFCGNPSVTPEFGLFTTYLAVSTDSLSSLAERFSMTETLLQLFNPLVDRHENRTAGEIVFIPSRNGTNGNYTRFLPGAGARSGSSSSQLRALTVAVSALGGVALVLFILVLWLSYLLCSRGKQSKKINHHDVPEPGQIPLTDPSGMLKLSGVARPRMLRFAGEHHSEASRSLSGPLASGRVGSSPLFGFTLDKSVEFSFDELAAATENFSVANKIGEGGHGAVYVATLRGQKTAVKRMNVQATREFVSELQILTHVHHTHLVQLVGYCTVDSLFLIYEYVENGPLERHLHGRHGLPPLSWAARVQIALDAARGLEYIHEHTKPKYIHRDFKSANLLLDVRRRAKVADFGLTKLTETGFGSMSCSLSRPVRLAGTFGYMSPEYVKYGDVSTKGDVYSFGVVLFEMISAKAAIVKTVSRSADPRIPDKEDQESLVAMFDKVLNEPPHEREALRGLVDPALGDSYPLDSAWSMARLAADCTHQNPDLRPCMRAVLVALMTLSCGSTGDGPLNSEFANNTH